ncbi:MAG: PAS domain S-box protein, partial [Dehalococcoidia bacterium]
MRDERKTKKQLIEEMEKARQRLAYLEKAEAKEKRLANEIDQRLQLEKKVAAISSRLTRAEELGQAITDSLREIGELSGADRAYIFIIRNNGEVIDNTHEWCREGVSAQIDNLQGVPCEAFPWWLEKMRAGEIIHIKDVASMPPEAAAEREIVKSQGIRSFILLPLQMNKQWSGFIGLDNVRENEPLSDDAMMALSMTRDVIANALERRRYEDELQEKELRYRELVENANSIIMRRDTDGKITFFNEFAESFFGYKKEEVLGRNVVGTIVPETDSKGRDLTEMVRNIGRDPESYARNENENMLRDGTRVWVSWTNKAIRDRDGRIMGVLCVGNDITDRKTAEGILREYSSAVEASLELIASVDRNYRYRLINQASLEYGGMSRDEVIGHTVAEVMGEKVFQNVIKPNLDRGLKGETVEYQMSYRYPGMGESYLDVSYFPLRTEGGEINRVVSVARDITEQKQVEGALKESEEKLREIFDNANDVIIYLDRTGTVIDINRRAEEIFGHKPEEVIGKNFTETEFASHGDMSRLAHEVSMAVESGNLKDLFELEAMHKDGHKVWLEASPSLIRRDGDIQGLLVIIREITERKQAEAKVLESERRYRSMFENKGTATGIFGDDGVIEMCNTRFEELSGYSREEIENRMKWSDFVAEDDLDRMREYHAQRSSGTGSPPQEYECAIIDKYGNRKHVTVNIGMMPETEYRIVSLTDITERKRAEDELSESRQRFRTAAHNASDLIWEWDLAGGRLEWYGNIDGLLGYEPGEFPRTIKAWEQIIAPEDHDRVMAALDEHLKMNVRYDEEYRVRRKDGTFRFWTDRGEAIWDETGKSYKMIGVCTDITERKQAEEGMREALGQSRQRAAEVTSLLEASKAVLGQDRFADAARIIFDSCKFATGATSGYVALLSNDGNENEVLFLDSGGLPCTVDPSLPMPIRGLRAETYRSGQAVFDNDFHNSEWMRYMPEGHVRLDNVMFAPLTAEGKVVGLLGLANKAGGFTDEDARLGIAFGELASIALRASLATEERERLLREIQQKSSDLEQILYATSHDLRSPLLNIQGFSSELEISLEEIRGLLEGREDVPDEVKTKLAEMIDEDIHDSLQYILTSTSKMDSLLGGLLQLSRLGRKPLEIEEIDMNALMEAITSIHKYRLTDGNITLEAGDLPPCRADRDQIDQVFSNLVDNAVKFLDPERPGLIRVSGERRDGEVVYCVEDNGVGMEPEYRGRIF